MHFAGCGFSNYIAETISLVNPSPFLPYPTKIMWKKIVQLSQGPRNVLRKVLALNDSAHAIALGVAIGIFVGLTPTVGVQTVLILGLVVLTRRFFYFNATAAMASTYVSNPLTMLPMYYGWYRVGAWFFSGAMTAEEFEALFQFSGMAGWWEMMCSLGSQVALPMCVGALLTAPIGVAIAYPLTYFLVKWVRDHKPGRKGRKSDGSATATESAGDAPTAEAVVAEQERRIDSSSDRRPKAGRLKPALPKKRSAGLQPGA